MGIMTCASGGSIWRGYEYYTAGKVAEFERIGYSSFQAKVSGSGEAVYDVYLDAEHIRKSHCNCPHANGKRIICKHIVALYFAVFPNEAKQYKKDVDDYEKQQEDRQDKLEEKVIKYVHSLSKAEAQQKLLELLFAGPEWEFDRFVRENLDEY